jgi:tRNA-specific 2-thiouridylase
MDSEVFEHHLTSPQGRGHRPSGAFTVTAEGGACGDTVTFSLVCDGQRITDAGFDAEGCGATTAAASAGVSLVLGAPLLDAARIGTKTIAAEVGGLSPGKLHAAEVVCDGLHRALGTAAAAAGGLAGPEERTLVAMSGGVDSAVAALLCARQGETVAVTLELWADHENDAERSCCSASAVSQARALGHSLGLPHFTLDLRDRFRTGVVEPFIAAYRAGETPNPCVGCNGHVRLDAMLELADRLGCATLATGHYARVDRDGQTALLRAAVDAGKDQTYMLAALSPRSLARMRFPLGEHTKPRVRAIAAAAGMPVASKLDSQDLCFLAGTSRARFFERHGGAAPRPGEIVDADGAVLGTHPGHELFTVGQRRGFGGRVPRSGEPLYVLAKDAASNRIAVGPRESLLTDRVRLRGARLHLDGDRVNRVRLRYRSEPLTAHLADTASAGRHRELTVELDSPIAGAAPGQLACLMDGDLIVGWGTIAAGQPVPAA